MRFQNVALPAFGHALPEERVSSDALEQRIESVYERLNLSVGRLELMSGIRERRFWPRGTRPSDVAARAGAAALAASGIERSEVGALVFASVCRDFLEPASASVVHHRLELPETCEAFDLSNACLGFASAMALVAGRIERGEIRAGLVVAGEDGRPLVEETLRALAKDDVGRAEVKRAYASLTIGSGAAGLVLAHADAFPDARRLLGVTTRADTQHHALCSGDVSEGGAGPLMETDSEALLQAGNALAASTFECFLDEHGWTRDSIERIVTHQVGAAHRRLLFETLALDTARDFPTVATLGNVGSVSLPISFALADEAGFFEPGDRIAMLGIGSGLQSAMLAVQ